MLDTNCRWAPWSFNGRSGTRSSQPQPLLPTGTGAVPHTAVPAPPTPPAFLHCPPLLPTVRLSLLCDLYCGTNTHVPVPVAIQPLQSHSAGSPWPEAALRLT